MKQSLLRGLIRLKSDRAVGATIFALTFIVFSLSPVHQVSDSTCSMLLSECLLKHRSFALDRCVSRSELQDREQVEVVKDHFYYLYPAATSVLSMPFVAVMNALGTSTVNRDWTYNFRAEVKMQAILAALLMAGLAGIFFFTARLVLPLSWSALIAFSGAFATQVWSTASRGMWSHTWEILLVALAILMLLGLETGKYKWRPVALASLLAWAFFARPTSSIAIVGISVYILIRHRHYFLPYALTGAVWALGFVVYSWIHFRSILPRYNRYPLLFDNFWIGIAGNLVSPSRGLLVYVPVLLFAVYLLTRYWQQVTLKRLAWLGVVVALGHLITISGSTTWWGGGCYGARMTTDLAPWFVLLSILAVSALLKSRERFGTKLSTLNWRVTLAAGGVLLLLSIFLNARGAISPETARWETWRHNARPVDKDTAALWEWRYPQFMAGLIRPPLPRDFPVIPDHLDLTAADSWRFLWYGWSGPEPQFRWTDGHEAGIIFAVRETGYTGLRMKCGPFLADKRVSQQRTTVTLNGHHLSTLVIRDAQPMVYEVVLPRELLRAKNVLVFILPDATAPNDLKLANDPRILGLSVEWIEFVKQ